LVTEYQTIALLLAHSTSIPEQPTSNLTFGTASAISHPVFGSALKNVLMRIPSTAADYPNKDPNSAKFLDVKAIMGSEAKSQHLNLR
jgi:hypothetical protein